MTKVASIRTPDLLSLAWSALRRNRLRSVLTIGAVGVGISVMMFLISLGLGLQRLTLDSVAQSNTLLTLTVKPSSEAVRPLTPKAIDSLKQAEGVKSVLPKLVTKGEVELDNRRAAVTINGVDGEYLVSGDERLTAGRAYRNEDQRTMVVTSGFLDLYGLDISRTPLVAFTITLDPETYPGIEPITTVTVSGVVEGNTVAIFLPRSYLETTLATPIASYDSARVRVESLDSVQSVSEAIVGQGFRVEAVVDTVEEIKRVFHWVRIILGTLGFIAVAVASIGMFNTLTISLLERTKEIGIMKALGVKKGDIRRLFLSESMIMGLLGGIIGIVMALIAQQFSIFILTLLASFVQGNVPVLFVNDISVILLFMALSLVVAAVTGIYPAQRAMRINPIEAIRYE